MSILVLGVFCFLGFWQPVVGIANTTPPWNQHKDWDYTWYTLYFWIWFSWDCHLGWWYMTKPPQEADNHNQTHPCAASVGSCFHSGSFLSKGSPFFNLHGRSTVKQWRPGIETEDLSAESPWVAKKYLSWWFFPQACKISEPGPYLFSQKNLDPSLSKVSPTPYYLDWVSLHLSKARFWQSTKDLSSDFGCKKTRVEKMYENTGRTS